MIFNDPLQMRNYGYEELNPPHAVKVLSALGLVARGVNILFLDLYYFGQDYDKFGFRNLADALQFLFESGDSYGVDIVTISIGFNIHEEFIDRAEYYSSLLYSKNYFMVCASGDEGNQYNYYEDF